ncbi:hypothetical protein Tco_1512195 [Tanacetum coccineum]
MAVMVVGSGGDRGGIGGDAYGGRCVELEVRRLELVEVTMVMWGLSLDGIWPEKQEGASEILEEKEKSVYVWLGFGNEMKETLMGEVSGKTEKLSGMMFYDKR